LTFSVTAVGVSPLGYQWYHHADELPAANTSTLAVTNAQLKDAGDYQVVVTNVFGSVTSAVARLGVDPAFTKITVAPMLADTAWSLPAWVDYDGDGDADLFIARRRSDDEPLHNALWRNDGSGHFTQVTNALTDDLKAFAAGVWADFDNDGLLDVFVGETASGILGCGSLYRNKGHDDFEKMPGDWETIGFFATGVACADYDGDGLVDLFVANFHPWAPYRLTSMLLRNRREMHFEDVPFDECIWGRATSGTWADADRDGDPDLYVSNFGDGTKNCFYRNQGGGIFNIINEGVVVEDAASSGVASWGDYDNDLLPDLFVGTCSLETGLDNKNRLYRNLGQGQFERILEGEIVNDDQHSLMGGVWGDYDNDGDLDLFVANGILFYSEDNGLYDNQGDGTFRKVTSGSLVHDGGKSWGAAWGDYDNDGFLDLFVVNSDPPEENFFYHNNGNSNHWIKIRCIGTAANRAGIGAKVFVTATIQGKLVTQMREISSGASQDGSGFIGAHFGLGDATIVDTLRIEWPGPKWTEQELHNVPVGKPGEKPLEIREDIGLSGPRLTAAWSDGLRLTLQGEFGATYVLEASPDLATWSVLETLTVTNPNGTVTYLDPESPRGSQRFYRAVKQPGARP
jgi:hypothetical protein